jgi:hypothetical protein
MQKNKINTFLSTLNLFLIFVGYALVTTLFFSSIGDALLDREITRNITIPYRFISTFISVIVLFLNFDVNKKINVYIQLLFILYGVYCIKVFIVTILLNSTVQVIYPNGYECFLWTIVTLLSMISFLYSIKKINFEKLLRWLQIVIFCILIISIYKNQLFLAQQGILLGTSRIAANGAFDTISFGKLSVFLFCLSFSELLFRKKSTIKRVLLIIAIAVSIYATLIAGSRGPLIALIFALSFILIFKQKYTYSKFLYIIFLSIILPFTIFSMLDEISPILYNRMLTTFAGSSGMERLDLFSDVMQQIIDYPLFGKDIV